MTGRSSKKALHICIAAAGGGYLLLSAIFVYYTLLLPPDSPSVALAAEQPQEQFATITVWEEDDFSQVAAELKEKGLIRSQLLFEWYARSTGRDLVRPGTYRIPRGLDADMLLTLLGRGARKKVTVRIPRGATIFEIDTLLASRHIIRPGSLVALQKNGKIEGKLFPDTYSFFTESSARTVAIRMIHNFAAHTEKIFGNLSRAARERTLTIASILEREVHGFEEMRTVAGIIERRLAHRMPLQMDATICYIKHQQAFFAGKEIASCAPILLVDLKLKSPYNTYLNRGLPPGPIGNPGISAIRAALSPKSSPYWYYLSDPITGRTVFSKTFDEHKSNKRKFLQGRGVSLYRGEH
ncbi:endolytic transglycosylase MltG [Candidatus Parcubacteria bacterium]|nr:MAG: endolytic transglycosylase MltG [Candidatus Parcubacteria bacterium]